MRLDPLERPYHRLDGPLQRLDPRLSLGATLAFVIAVVATPVHGRVGLVVEGLILTFAVGISGVPFETLVRRWLRFVPVFALLALVVAETHPRKADLGLGTVAVALFIKNSLALSAVLLLGSVVPLSRLLVAMRQLGAPTVLVTTLQFMERYLHVLADELHRMVEARRARTFRRRGGFDWGLLTGLIGVLFLRTFERGERVYAAMLARGWDGTVRTLDSETGA